MKLLPKDQNETIKIATHILHYCKGDLKKSKQISRRVDYLIKIAKQTKK